jgi:hypothetical protein
MYLLGLEHVYLFHAAFVTVDVVFAYSFYMYRLKNDNRLSGEGNGSVVIKVLE